MLLNAKVIGILVGALVNLTTATDWALAGYPARNNNDCRWGTATFALQGSNSVNCQRFPPATTGIEFDGYGEWGFRLCGGLNSFDICEECVEYDGDGTTGCQAFAGYSYYQIFKK